MTLQTVPTGSVDTDANYVALARERVTAERAA
jgi:hypothetical protein